MRQGYVFTCVCDSVHREGWYPSMHCRWYPSIPCRQSPWGVGGWGLGGWGVVSQHALQVSRPTPRGEVEGSGLGGLQAHTQGASPGPHSVGVSEHALRQTPPRRLLLWVVRILLECILVFFYRCRIFIEHSSMIPSEAISLSAFVPI